MPVVRHIPIVQGFKPVTRRPPRRLEGLRGLGDSNNTFSGCVQAYDSQSNPVACNDPSAAVWVDANGNAVPAGTPVAAAPGAGGAPTSSVLLYQGRWQVTPTLNINTIISRVSQLVQQYGLQVVNAQNSGGALTLTNFDVMLSLQVTGSGFNQPGDAGSIVDHAYYLTTGRMPVFSSTSLQSAGGQVPSLVPPGAIPPPAAQNPNALTWFEGNAWWIVGALVAAAVLPKVL